MEKHRQVTEEDIILTEELITRSYGRLKQSVVQAPSRALRCVGNTLKEHPIAAAGAAVGAGITLYGNYISSRNGECIQIRKGGKYLACIQLVAFS